MRIYDLTFTDGKSCRYLSPEPEATDEAERKGVEAIFCGRLASMIRIITPPPAKLPWVRQTKTLWTLELFALSRLGPDELHCLWPGGEVTGDKDEISATVRLHWEEGVLT